MAGVPAGINVTLPTETADGEISGTPTSAGSGTITITATNSEGSDDWTLGFTTAAPLVAPAFSDNTGDAQNWTVGTAIASITIPRASGNPDPTYSLVSSPAGINVSLPTTGADGAITGTPTAAGSGTVWIRALNSEGSANWTVAYTTVAPVVTRTGSGEPGEVTAAGIEGTGRSIVPLLLSDWSTPSGQVDVFVALIEIEVSGTDRYRESTGVGTLLDGDMEFQSDYGWDRIGITTGNTRINFAQQVSRTLDAQTLFEGGGEYAVGTVYAQDLDGVESQAVEDIPAERIGTSGINIENTLNQAFFDKVAGLATGNRLIVAFTSPSVPVTGSGEAGEAAASGVEGTGRKIDAAARTGSGEAGSVATAGIEGTGQAIPVVVRTGSGEPGEVAAAGIEGTGRKISVVPLMLSSRLEHAGRRDGCLRRAY